MKIINLKANKEIKYIRGKTTLAVGNFDGVHIGHRALLDEVKSTALNLGTKTAVWSFFDFSPKSRGRCITLPAQRQELIRRCGVDYMILYEYDSVKDMVCEDFLTDIIIGRCHALSVCCGYNFRFGRGAQGDSEELCRLMRANGRQAHVLPAVKLDGKAVSSSLIRECIACGDMESARKYLGRPFCVTLPVVYGRQLGRQLGVPTINQNFPALHIIPRLGVYACYAYIDGVRYKAVANVGDRPSVSDGGGVNCETHIISYSGDLYDREIRVDFMKFIRPERKFPSLDALKAAIETDKAFAEEQLKV